MSKSKWVGPKGFTKSFSLSNGEGKATVTHLLDIVDVKIRVFGRYYRGLNDTGPIHKVKVKVPSTHISLKLANGTILKSRSCCKPPDVFRKWEGINRAARRLVKSNKSDFHLTRSDRRKVMEALCPGLFSKKSDKTVADKTVAAKKIAAAPRKTVSEVVE